MHPNYSVMVADRGAHKPWAWLASGVRLFMKREENGMWNHPNNEADLGTKPMQFCVLTSNHLACLFYRDKKTEQKKDTTTWFAWYYLYSVITGGGWGVVLFSGCPSQVCLMTKEYWNRVTLQNSLVQFRAASCIVLRWVNAKTYGWLASQKEKYGQWQMPYRQPYSKHSLCTWYFSVLCKKIVIKNHRNVSLVEYSMKLLNCTKFICFRTRLSFKMLTNLTLWTFQCGKIWPINQIK